MFSLHVLKRAWSRLRLIEPPASIIELGAGDGTLLLRLAKSSQPTRAATKLVLLDRQQVVSGVTLEEFRGLGWDVRVECKDVLEWARESKSESYDLCITTLFLHHFRDPELRLLLDAVAKRSSAFIAIEPHRGALAIAGSNLVSVLGVNAVTREDAIKSVSAGFLGTEITEAWPIHAGTWCTQEFRAFPFSQCFVAARKTAQSARSSS